MSQVNGDHRPPYQVFPDLSPEEFETLKQDIAERGVQVAIELTPEGEILDGHQEGPGLSGTEDQELPTTDHQRAGRGRQAAPRHQGELLAAQLTRHQKKDLIAAELKRKPRQSNRLLAEVFGVDKKTIAAYRHELELTAEIPHLESLSGRTARSTARRACSPPLPPLLGRLKPSCQNWATSSRGKASEPSCCVELVNQKRRERADFKVNGDPLPRQIKLYNCDFREVGKKDQGRYRRPDLHRPSIRSGVPATLG